MKSRLAVPAVVPLLLLLGAAPTSRPALQPIPSQAQQEEALRLIQKLFKDDYQRKSPNDQAALARLLIQEAKNTNDNSAGRYVLLTESLRLCIAAGDADTLAEAATLLAARFDVKQAVLLADALPRILEKPRTTVQLRALATQALATIDLLTATEHFALIEPLANTAEAAATKVRQVDFAAKVTARVSEARETVAEWKSAEQAAARLKSQPDSAHDHLTLGRFYALRLGQFDKGLPELAAGSDTTLARIARMDLTAPAEPLAQKALADAWWDYAASTRDAGRALERSKFWYAKARDSLTGLTLRDIDGRLASSPTSQPAITGIPAATEAATDILTLAKSTLSSAEGQWAFDNAVLTGSGKLARLQLPLMPPAEYDMEMTFSREGRGGVALLLASGDKNFNLMLDVSGTARLEMVNKKTRTDNPTLTTLDLDNGKTYTVVAQVRRTAVYVLLDGKPLLSWRTDYQDLSRPSQWKLADSKCLGIGISSGTLRVERLTLKPVSGQPTILAKPN